MLELTVKEKERIGKLFKYYRKKNKIQWKEIKFELSTSTYSNMEKGKIYKDDYLYKSILSFMGVQYQQIMKFEEWLNSYLIRMNDVFEYYKEEEFDFLTKELDTKLESYKHQIIYEQYYQVITYILNYYKYSKYMTLNEIKDCLEIIKCIDFEEIIMVYLLEVMFISNNNAINNIQLMEDLLSLINQYENIPVIWYLQGGYYKCHALFDSALERFNKSFNYYHDRNNSYRTAKSLMGKYIIYKNIDAKKAEETTELLIQLKEESKLYQSLIPNINFNIGMFYYLNYKYEKAYELFLENIIDYDTRRDWIYLCACCTQLELKIPDEIKEIENYEDIENICLKYFIMKKSNVTKKELVNYIMKTIVQQVLIYEKYRQPLWKIFEEELLQFSQKDKRFVDTFMEFMLIEKKMCENY